MLFKLTVSSLLTICRTIYGIFIYAGAFAVIAIYSLVVLYFVVNYSEREDLISNVPIATEGDEYEIVYPDLLFYIFGDGIMHLECTTVYKVIDFGNQPREDVTSEVTIENNITTVPAGASTVTGDAKPILVSSVSSFPIINVKNAANTAIPFFIIACKNTKNNHPAAINLIQVATKPRGASVASSITEYTSDNAVSWYYMDQAVVLNIQKVEVFQWNWTDSLPIQLPREPDREYYAHVKAKYLYSRTDFVVLMAFSSFDVKQVKQTSSADYISVLLAIAAGASLTLTGAGLLLVPFNLLTQGVGWLIERYRRRRQMTRKVIAAMSNTANKVTVEDSMPELAVGSFSNLLERNEGGVETLPDLAREG